MREEILRAALEAAAKDTMSAVVLAGCSGEHTTSPTATAPTSAATTATTAAATSTSTSAPPPPQPDCKDLVHDAFSGSNDPYPGAKKSVSPEVARCCDKLLIATDGMMDNRWDCCANHSPSVNIGAACTPWGPPMPPEMT
jgi:hypothetical protein